MSQYKTITATDLIGKLGIETPNINSAFLKEKLNFKHTYRELIDHERDEVILSIINSLEKNKFRVSGENDNTVWEKGWGEVLSTVKNSTAFSSDLLLPQYFKKENISRLFGGYIVSEQQSFEYDLDQAVRCAIFSKYLLNQKRIVEIGCGTGNSQYLLSKLCPSTTALVGADWATPSLELLQTISKNVNRPIQPVLFNMLNLEGYDDLQIDSESTVLTVHTLEQLGKSYKPLLNRLLSSKPALCVHIEPIKELYNQNNLFDYLAIKYHDIRNYLDGWLTELKALEVNKKVKILEEKRIQMGNKFHDAYNLIVWQPC